MIFILAAACGAVIIVLVPRPALATQPPPPAAYELTITKVGGDDNCKFGAEPPTPVQYEVTQFQRTYTASTDITLRQIIDCPSEYRFDHWESNEDNVDGHVDLQEVEFNITKNTWVKAYFVAVSPRATDYSNVNMSIDVNTGILTVHYKWNSSSDELEDLEGQNVIEVITYDPDVEFETDVLSFLCTGQTESSEKLTLDPPWDQMGQVPRIWRGGRGSEAEDGVGTDTHTRPNRPSGCSGQCSYTIRQWYVARKNGGQDYKVEGPYEITRTFEYFQGAWIYTIEKHGEQYWIVLPRYQQETVQGCSDAGYS